LRQDVPMTIESHAMRSFVSWVAIPAAVALSHAALAQQPPVGGCEAKRVDIARDIEQARARGQTRRVRGLEKALRETQANCSDARLEKEHEARIARQEKKVAERRRDLEEARAQGKAGKIASREAKLAEEEAQLRSLRDGAR